MIITLPVTILIEGGVVLIYCVWRKKPPFPVLVTSIIGNIITQSLLWVVLNIYFQHYLAALLIMETLIWVMEATLLFRIKMNWLCVKEALLLSLVMNVSSFGVGIMLPV